VLAVPALAYAVATSKLVPGVQENAVLLYGNVPLVKLFVALFHPHIDPRWMLLSPIGAAAWVGIFVTGLNLLPAWQLDGGHILYCVASENHRRISLAVALALLGIGIYCWHGWALWGILLLVLTLRFRHPPVLDQWQSLDRPRRAWAVVALVMFLLCITAWPAANP